LIVVSWVSRSSFNTVVCIKTRISTPAKTVPDCATASLIWRDDPLNFFYHTTSVRHY
jgi:hypothetical protein